MFNRLTDTIKKQRDNSHVAKRDFVKNEVRSKISVSKKMSRAIRKRYGLSTSPTNSYKRSNTNSVNSRNKSQYEGLPPRLSSLGAQKESRASQVIKIKDTVDRVWEEYDADGNGELDKEETFKFVKHTIGQIEGDK